MPNGPPHFSLSLYGARVESNLRKGEAMPTGKKKCDPPAKDNHMKHFDDAMKNALENWNGPSDQNVDVAFQVTVSPNPGGIKEYRVIIGG